jgi:hypothetical protein
MQQFSDNLKNAVLRKTEKKSGENQSLYVPFCQIRRRIPQDCARDRIGH